MKCQWIAKWIATTQNPNLILFFNGWGMDQRIVSHLHADADTDVLMVYDYRDLSLADETIRDINAYQYIDVLAWSMGVWAYTTVQEQFANRIRRAIALNGTLRPIDDEYGIPETVYNATIQHFSEAGRTKFFQRMCGSAETVQWFGPHQPQRSLDEQREELIAIQRAARLRHPQTITPFTCALISRRDKIIPTQHQLEYWRGTVDYTLIDSPHCAFGRWNSWKEIFDHVTAD